MSFAARRSGFLIALAALAVAGCASTPVPKPAAPPPPAPPQEPSAAMAPIPNPTPQREEPRHIVHVAPSEPQSQKAPPPPPPPPHANAPTNPLRAAQLRGAGLEQLNRGAIGKAISLLKEANELDPGNALIKHDLDRALRVAKALHDKH